MNLPDDPRALQTLPDGLELDHHDLATSGYRLTEQSLHDELLLRRPKKRKLLLEGRIITVKRLLGPGLTA
ncbi:MAG: hypothetical protein ACK4Q4_02115 [Rhodocyclaceae bacterium]